MRQEAQGFSPGRNAVPNKIIFINKYMPMSSYLHAAGLCLAGDEDCLRHKQIFILQERISHQVRLL